MKNKPSKISLRNTFLHLQHQMIARHTTNRKVLQHPGTKGEAAEVHWVKMLADYLPERYCAAKAFVLDCKGSLSDQIDVVIYDRQYSPFLFNQDGAKYVPAESVYAVFEVKQDLTLASGAGPEAAALQQKSRYLKCPENYKTIFKRY
jgi:hypothetical protein